MKLKVNVIRDKGNVKYVGNQILAAKLRSQIFPADKVLLSVFSSDFCISLSLPLSNILLVRFFSNAISL